MNKKKIQMMFKFILEKYIKKVRRKRNWERKNRELFLIFLNQGQNLGK